MSKKTQKERVIDYIREFGSISAFEAFKDLGIMQLSARLCELEAQGYEFNRIDESALNRFGERIYYKRYFLKEEEVA